MNDVNSYTIIDIRSLTQYSNGHIPGAVSIDAYDLISNPAKYLEKNKTYYIYCNSGIQSEALVEKLIFLGYSAVNIGSYRDYLHKR